MIVQCATFSKSLIPQNIDKSVSDIRIRIRFPFESRFWISLSGCKLTIPGYPTGKPDSDHQWWIDRMLWGWTGALQCMSRPV